METKPYVITRRTEASRFEAVPPIHANGRPVKFTLGEVVELTQAEASAVRDCSTFILNAAPEPEPEEGPEEEPEGGEGEGSPDPIIDPDSQSPAEGESDGAAAPVGGAGSGSADTPAPAEEPVEPTETVEPAEEPAVTPDNDDTETQED